MNAILKRLQILFPILLLLNSVLIGQVNHSIMSYNLLNYPGSDTTTRNPYFRTTIASVVPDVLVVQEMTSQAGVNGFLSNVLIPINSSYSAGTFINGTDTDNAIFYRSDLFNFISNTPIATSLRDINEFKLASISTSDTLRIYSVHLKASTGTTNEQQRLAEVTILRNITDALTLNEDFLVCGDFNIYGSTEPAYQKLSDQSTAGYFIDLFSLSGTWNNSAYAQYHTQSTRTRQFGGGANGGLDDRFDMILFSQELIDSGGITYVPNTYTAYGNDGLHYNDSINRPSNTAVGQIIADALHYSSDHLPVFATFRFEGLTSINTPLDITVLDNFILYQNYPNPFNPTTTIKFNIPYSTFVTLTVFDVLGNEIVTLVNDFISAGNHKISLNASDLPSGIYFYSLNSDGIILNNKMILLK